MKLVALCLIFFVVNFTVFAVETTVTLSDDPTSEFESNASFHFDRKLFGNSAFGLWSPLTEFEQFALNQRMAAQQGDADALLGLFIIASGSYREFTDFQQIKNSIDNWIQSISKTVNRQRKISKKGSVLHHAMHEQFFLADEDGSSLIGYDADQSQLTKIFRTKQFNCISSSLLYLVIARKFDLAVEGVLLPSHAYVQLKDEKNSLIEIETTSVYGFNVEHNQDYYDNSDQQWFIERNLEPTTYQDYLDRKIVSAFELGLHNMWSQHTSPDRMDYQDRMRLAEIRSFLQPDDVGAQKIRLNYYLQELGFLNRAQDQTTLARLIFVIEPYLETVASHRWGDQELKSLWIGTQTEIAFAKIQNDEAEIGFQLAKQLLELPETNTEQNRHLKNNLWVVVSHFIQQNLIQSNSTPSTLAQLRLDLIGLESGCIENLSCSHMFGQLYGVWAQQSWDRQDWRNASRILTEYLQFDIDNENTAIFQKNAEMAYINDAKDNLLDGDWEQALSRLQDCADQLSDAAECDKQMRTIKEQRHLGNL